MRITLFKHISHFRKKIIYPHENFVYIFHPIITTDCATISEFRPAILHFNIIWRTANKWNTYFIQRVQMHSVNRSDMWRQKKKKKMGKNKNWARNGWFRIFFLFCYWFCVCECVFFFSGFRLSQLLSLICYAEILFG